MEADAQIKAPGKRLNAALATKVQELARYRSEFFGRLREILGDSRDILNCRRSVCFSVRGFAQVRPTWNPEVGNSWRVWQNISCPIEKNSRRHRLILRVDGHTDSVPIFNEKFRSMGIVLRTRDFGGQISHSTRDIAEKTWSPPDSANFNPLIIAAMKSPCVETGVLNLS